MMAVFVAFLHFFAAFGLAATLFAELMLLRPEPTLREARLLQWCDRWYGMFAGIVLGAGLFRVLYYAKGTAFYMSNPFFHLKITLYVITGLISIYPTITFLRWSKDIKAGIAPVISSRQYSRLRSILLLELVLLTAILASASLMARGIAS